MERLSSMTPYERHNLYCVLMEMGYNPQELASKHMTDTQLLNFVRIAMRLEDLSGVSGYEKINELNDLLIQILGEIKSE